VFLGTVTVGERGQVVIPAEARKRFSIHPGDRLLVIAHPSGHGLMLVGIEAAREFINTFMQGLDSAEARAHGEEDAEV
jgi:AbrB family looped-hinge helix DNA binding protein